MLEGRHQLEALTPFLRGRGVQPQVVVLGLVANHKINLPQGQGRYAALLVRPLNRSLVNDKFGLGEKPVRSGVVVALTTGKVEACYKDATLGRAANAELGLINVELLEPQAQQGSW